MKTNILVTTLFGLALVLGCQETTNNPPGDESLDGTILSNMQRSKNSVRPVRFMAEDEANPAEPDIAGGAKDAEASVAYDESCEIIENEDGTISEVCDYGDMTCVMTYDAEGDFLQWVCDEASYVCEHSESEIFCEFDDGAGFTCTDTWDPNWNLIESTCYDMEPDPLEECEEQEDDTSLCLYDDGYYTCEYLFDELGNIIRLECTSEFESIVCETSTIDCYRGLQCDAPVDVFACSYVFGDQSCQEVYTEDWMGLLDSNCDYNMDGEQDCVVNDEDNMLVCAFDDGYYACESGFDVFGQFAYQSCTCEGGSFACSMEAEEEVIACKETYFRQECEYTYDLNWNYIEGSCIEIPCDSFEGEQDCLSMFCEWNSEDIVCEEPVYCYAIEDEETCVAEGCEWFLVDDDDVNVYETAEKRSASENSYAYCGDPIVYYACEELGGTFEPYNPEYECPEGTYFEKNIADPMEGSICCVPEYILMEETAD